MAKKQQFSQIEGDGRLVTYVVPYDAVTAEMMKQGPLLSDEIKDIKQQINQSFLVLAVKLAEFEDGKFYLADGAPSMAQWCESPEIDIAWRTAQDLIRIARKVLPLYRKYEELPSPLEMGVAKTRALLPLLQLPNGEERFVEKAQQLVDAGWTWRDTVAEVKEERGIATNISQPLPVVFMAKITSDDKITRAKITGSDGNNVKECGVLNIPNGWWSKWEAAFGKFVQIEQES